MRPRTLPLMPPYCRKHLRVAPISLTRPPRPARVTSRLFEADGLLVAAPIVPTGTFLVHERNEEHVSLFFHSGKYQT